MRPWRVEDVMSTDVVSVTADTPYREIVDILAERRVSAVPVMSSTGQVIGVVSEADLLHKIEFGDEEQQRRVFVSPRRRHARAKAHAGTAGELMSQPAVTVLAGTLLTAAAKLMDDEQIKRLPVVDELGRLHGIVSRADLLRLYLRPDEEIKQDVAEGVLHRTLWVEPEAVTVEVRDAVVTLTGRTDRYSTKQLAIRLTQLVPGVVEVVDHVSFDYDDHKLAEVPPVLSGLGAA